MSERLRIDFDRDDRTYRTGDVVSGRVLVDTERGERCESVMLTRYWKTHGKGNTARGGERQIVLHAGPLEGPGPWEFPFEVDTPPLPFTHRGDYVNVDHYLRVDVDIPWAFDPKNEEEYILRPGPDVPEPDPSLLGRRAAKKQGAAGCRRVLGILFVLVGVVTLPLGIVFMGVGVLFLVPDMRRKLAGLKVGDVSVEVDRRRLAPGSSTDVEVRVRPSKEARLTEATAVLRGREVCVSGSGTDRTTHTNVLHEIEVSLSGPKVLLAGQTARLRARVGVPEDAPWSFSAKDNDVTWDVVVRLHIPSWPDWLEEIPLLVWPTEGERTLPAGEADGEVGGSALEAAGEALRGVPAAAEPVGPGSEALSSVPHPGVELAGEPEEGVEAVPEGKSVPPEVPEPEVGETAEAWEPIEAREPPTPPESAGVAEPREATESRELPEPFEATEPPETPELPGVPEVGEVRPGRARKGGEDAAAWPLVAQVRAILAEPSYGGRRKELEDELVGSFQSFEVDVERVERSFGVWDAPDYRDGSTLVGTVAGSDVKVLARFPPSLNETLRGVERGERRAVQGTVAEWERLRERVVLHAEGRPGPGG